ncbi:MAG: transposase [Clostridia bacterium]|nr:transposase [Clostridia bacterium]
MLPKRKHPRLKDWDYNTEACYFLTLCTKSHKPILSRIVGRSILDAPEIKLTKCGKAVQNVLAFYAENETRISVLASVIMPNHVHLIVRVNAEGGASGMLRPTGAEDVRTDPKNETVPRFVSALKRAFSKKAGTALWQTSYYDHIIRDEADYLRILQYIENNPAKWSEDKYYTEILLGGN